MVRQRIQHVGHHFQINHGGFVDHQHVQRQPVARMMTEVPRTGSATEESVNGGHITGDFLPKVVVHFKGFDLKADGFRQTCSGFPGGRGQANPQRRAGFHGGGLQQGQQTHDGGGFACTGAARDDAEGTTGGQRTGQFLPVNRRIRLRTAEQGIQARRQVVRRHLGHGQALTQRVVDSSLVRPITPQVHTPFADH